MGRFYKLIGLGLFFADLAGVIYPAFVESEAGKPPPSVTQTIISIFLQPHFGSLSYVMRLICLIVLAGMVYIVVTTWVYRKVPLTVVRTDIRYELNSDLSRAVVRREQILRANWPDVGAHFSTVKPSRGHIPKDSMKLYAVCSECAMPDTVDLTGTETSGYEIIHSFGNNMPYAWYMLAIPGWTLNKPYNQMLVLIQKKLVVRNISYEAIQEYNGPDAVMSFTATTYPQLNINVSLHFEGGIPQTIKAGRVKSNGVVSVPVIRNGNTASVTVSRLKSEMLRISWKNEISS